MYKPFVDNGGRYSYQRQPSICEWNLGKLAEALSPCMSSELAAEGIKMYEYVVCVCVSLCHCVTACAHMCNCLFGHFV